MRVGVAVEVLLTHINVHVPRRRTAIEQAVVPGSRARRTLGRGPPAGRLVSGIGSSSSQPAFSPISRSGPEFRDTTGTVVGWRRLVRQDDLRRHQLIAARTSEGHRSRYGPQRHEPPAAAA